MNGISDRLELQWYDTVWQCYDKGTDGKGGNNCNNCNSDDNWVLG